MRYCSRKSSAGSDCADGRRDFFSCTCSTQSLACTLCIESPRTAPSGIRDLVGLERLQRTASEYTSRGVPQWSKQSFRFGPSLCHFKLLSGLQRRPYTNRTELRHRNSTQRAARKKKETRRQRVMQARRADGRRRSKTRENRKRL